MPANCMGEDGTQKVVQSFVRVGPFHVCLFDMHLCYACVCVFLLLFGFIHKMCDSVLFLLSGNGLTPPPPKAPVPPRVATAKWCKKFIDKMPLLICSRKCPKSSLSSCKSCIPTVLIVIVGHCWDACPVLVLIDFCQISIGPQEADRRRLTFISLFPF